MFEPPVIQELTGGRLHLSHGPIDVVLKAFGAPAAVAEAHRAAARRFPEILPELCAELPALRAPLLPDGAQDSEAYPPQPAPAKLARGNRALAKPVHPPPARGDGKRLPRALRPSPLAGEGGPSEQRGPGEGANELAFPAAGFISPVARRMAAACRPFADVFVTPMAAVAGAVADELLAVMREAAPLERAFVNDGGDIALYCAPGQHLEIGVAGEFALSPLPALNGTVRVGSDDGIGGIATSGARGRSLSLGIADSVTVLAPEAAAADVAATLIANAVDCDSAAVSRRPACGLDADSDLGERQVTVAVGNLSDGEIDAALAAGLACACRYRDQGLIVDAALMLKGRVVTLGATVSGARKAMSVSRTTRIPPRARTKRLSARPGGALFACE